MALTAPTARLAAFDPTGPKDGTLIVAGVPRDQFVALFDAIQDCATEAELNASISTLNAAIAQRTTQADVTAAMNDAVATATNNVLPQTSNNTYGLSTPGLSASSCYEQWQMQSVMDKVDEMINVLWRY